MRHQFARLPAGIDRPAMSYVERGGELVTRHPFDLTGVRMYGFAVRADNDRLRELCERTFGGPSGGTEDFVPIGSHVLVAFTEIQSLQSSESPDDGLGICSEREACVWLPIFDRRRDRVCWTLPYLFVDQPAPMAGGREIFGFPKQLGTVTFPEPDSQSPRFAVSAPCIGRFDAAARMVTQRVFMAGQVPPAGNGDVAEPAAFAGGQSQWANASEGLRAMKAHVGAVSGAADIPLPRRPRDFAGLASALSRGRLGAAWIDEARAVAIMLSHLGFGRLPIVLLKQFRDVADPRRACYQAIVDVEQEILQFHGGSLLGGRWVVEIEDLDGEPLQRELGLKATSRADLAFRLDFQFRIRTGQVLWEAGG